MKKANRVHTDCFAGIYSMVMGSFSISEQAAKKILLSKRLAIRNGFNYNLKTIKNNINNLPVTPNVVDQPRCVPRVRTMLQTTRLIKLS